MLFIVFRWLRNLAYITLGHLRIRLHPIASERVRWEGKAIKCGHHWARNVVLHDCLSEYQFLRSIFIRSLDAAAAEQAGTKVS